MNGFMDKNFLLTTSTARALYHDVAAKLPVLDYHCHLSPEAIAKDQKFRNITELWLGGDHYRWRLMRTGGVPERFITGQESDHDKFIAFAGMLPQAMGNPVYHWTHLELQRYFDCDTPLSGDTAEEIWTLCNAKLQEDQFSVRNLVRRSRVTGLATTDDPIDSLEWHKAIAADASFDVTVKPAWRPDRLMNINQADFADYIKLLSRASGTDIHNMKTLREATIRRMEYFDEMGCTASDHGIEMLECVPATAEALDAILAKAMSGEAVTEHELLAYQYALLSFLGSEYASRDWAMELHFGARRNNNTMRYRTLGADTGFDAIAMRIRIDGLPILLDTLYQKGTMPKIVLFSLNPNDNAMLSTLCACYQRSAAHGYVQQGAAWWFNDSRDGMLQQMTTFANTGLLGCFLGMVTDSRSFTAYPRHEYFRRILCELMGSWVENGEYPDDKAALKTMLENICYYNAKAYFRF